MNSSTWLSGLDWAVVAGYFAVTILVGLRFSRRASQGIEEFFLAGRNLTWWLAGFSMVASMFASDTPLFHCGNIRDVGLSGAWLFILPMFGALLAAALFARLVRRTGVVTDAQFIELRYSGEAPAFYRGFLALYYGVLVAALTLGWVTKGMQTTLVSMTGWDPLLSVVVMLAVVVLYSTASGMWGVVMTDLLQYIVASLGSIFLAVAAVRACGGLAAMREGIANLPNYSGADLHIWPTANETSFSSGEAILSIPLIAAWIFVYGSQQAGASAHQGQRVLACRTERDAALTYVLYSFCYYVVNGLSWFIIGLSSLIILGATNESAGLRNSQEAFPVMIKTLLPVGLVGFMFAAVFAAFMSTVSTLLNWGSAYLVNDFYARFFVPTASQRHYVRVARITSVAIAVFGGWFCLRFSGLAEMMLMIPTLLIGAVLILLARWLWWRISIWSEVSAMIASPLIGGYMEFVVGGRIRPSLGGFLPGYAWWSKTDPSFVGWEFFGEKLLATTLLTTAVSLIVTFLTPPTDLAKLQDFYRRVRPPGPGWNRVRQSLPETVECESLSRSLWIWLAACLLLLGLILMGLEVIRGELLLAVFWGGAAVLGSVLLWRLLRPLQNA